MMPVVMDSFPDATVHQSQQVFRAVLDAMSRPGKIQQVDASKAAFAAPLSTAAAEVCLALVDFEVTLWLDETAAGAAKDIAFHCGCSMTSESQQAQFAVIANAAHLDDFGAFAIGTDEHPEHGATVIVEVSGLEENKGQALSGPGIDGVTHLEVSGVQSGFWAALAGNRALFPCGIDLILTCGERLAALPRSVRVEG